ncbi:MAG TPA: ABC transporter permease [Mycobacteriales bacterium]|nr:ABC transporter permease [Mycobacteriales bacterium]
MTTFLHFTVIGLVVGCIYALTASGIVVTYTTSGIFNFAHGAVGMFAAWTYWQLRVDWHWPTPAAFLFVIGVIAPAMGVVIERLLIRPLHGAAVDLTLVVTLGLFLTLIGLVTWIWDQNKIRVTPHFFARQSVAIAGFRVTYEELLVVVAAVVVAIGLRLLFNRTRIGIAMRAVVDDPDLVAAAGANPVRIQQMSWALGTTLASLSGVLLAPIVTLTVIPLTLVVINGYAAAVIGRLRSLPATVVGALGVGLGYNYLIGYSNSAFLRNVQLIVPMIALFIVLIVLKPARLRLSSLNIVRMPRPASPRAALTWSVLLVAAAAVVGPQLSVVNLRIASHGLALGVVMLSAVLLTGYGGLASLCQMTFVGLGAYAMGHVGGHAGNPLGLVAAAALAAGFGVLVALPTLRLRGLYLALATLAFAQAMDTVFFTQVLGAGGAIHVARFYPPGVPHTDSAYFVELAVVFALAGAGLLAVRRGPFGRRLSALSDSPAACATLGLDINRTKLLVFAASAALAGVGGALWEAVPGQGSNNDFLMLQSLVLLLLVRIGGINTVTGAFLAAAFYTGFQILQSHYPAVGNLQYLLTGIGAMTLGRSPNGMGGRVAEAAAELRARRAAPRSPEVSLAHA